MLRGIEIPSQDGTWFVMATSPDVEPEKKAIGRIFPESIKPLSEVAEKMLKSFYSFRLTFGSAEEIEDGAPVIIPCINYKIAYKGDNRAYETFMEYGVLATVKENLIIPKLRKAHFGELKISNEWPTIERIER